MERKDSRSDDQEVFSLLSFFSSFKFVWLFFGCLWRSDLRVGMRRNRCETFHRIKHKESKYEGRNREKMERERDNKQNQNRRQYYLTIRYRKRKNTTKLLSSIWQEQRKRNVFDLFSFLAWAVLLLGEPIYFLSHCIFYFYFYIFFLPINVFLFACSII